MGQHAVRPAAAILNAALLLVLFKCSRSVGAFVFTHPNTCKSTLKGSSGRHCTCALPPTQLSPSRARAVLLHENVGRLPAAGVVRRPCAPAAVYVGRGMAQRTRCYAAGGTRGAGVVDGRTGYGPEANRRGILAQQHKKGGDTGAGGDCEGAGGFEWLREFGNGKMDITGLVLSTVLLMTAAAPLGVAADMAVVDGRGLDQPRLNEPTELHLRADSAPPVSEARVKHNSDRVGALNFGSTSPKLPRVAPISGVGNRATLVDEEPKKIGTLAKEAETMTSAARGVADRARAVASRTQEKDRPSSAPRATDAIEPAQREEEASPLNFGTPAGSVSSGSVDETASFLSPGEAGTSSVLESLSEDVTRLEGQVEERSEELRLELLKELESEHEELFGESLPLSTMQESFNRALRKALPALIPPAMAVFLTVSMPAVILLLKGVGTTLVAVAKGYGKGGQRQSEGGDGDGAAVEVGFRSGSGGGGGGGGGGSEKGRGQISETAGSTFQMFLGGGDRVGAGVGVDASGRINTNGEEESRRLAVLDGSGPVGSAASASPSPVQQVHSERHGFFDRRREQQPKSTGGRGTATADGGGSGSGGRGGGRGNNSDGGGFAVGDDAMAAMAMAAMTQELNIMKQSLQTEVETMKKDLEVASEDSRRLTDKLFRLEEDNRQLEAMVSRLGGQDARRLKAQLFSLLASPSMGQPGDSSSFPQLTPA